ncbi:fibronectin type III domain-containing protein [bacterium]|nr:fibronectin type III domain-containing protein [bacterium]
MGQVNSYNKFLKFLFLVGSSIFFLFLFSFSTQAATLDLSSTSTSFQVGDIFEVQILLDTQNSQIDGVDIHYLNYDNSLLEVQDADSATSGVQIAPGSLLQETLVNSVEATSGKIDFSQVTNPGTTYNGNGILATITFKVLSEGTTTLTFDFTSGDTTDCNVASEGSDILSSVGTLTLTFSSSSISTCEDLGGTCQDNPCDQYHNCSSLNGSCDSGYCCSGDCLPNCTDLGGVCKSNSCSNYNNCSSLSGYCDSGHCCSGSCTAKSSGGGGGGGASIDRTPPTISEIRVKELTTSTALIYWKTNERATSKVNYGTSSEEYNFSTSSSALVSEHQILIQDLLPATRYYFVVISKDSSGNQRTSEEFDFQTLIVPQKKNLGKIEVFLTENSFEGSPLEKVTLTLLPLNYQCVTDKNGKCAFEDIPEGIYSIKGEKKNHISYTKKNIEVVKNKTIQVKIYLKEEKKAESGSKERGETTISVIFTQNLYPGQKNEQVKKLQELLATDKDIYPEGLITGYYGTLTTKAVQKFQCKYNIICSGSPQTTGWGLVGSKTRKKLNEVFGKKKTIDKNREALIEAIKEQIRYLQKLVLQLIARLNKLIEQRKLKLKR